MDQNTERLCQQQNSDTTNSKAIDSVRFVDINSEILGGKGVKPGLVLTEDDVIDLTEEIPEIHLPAKPIITTAKRAIKPKVTASITAIAVQTYAESWEPVKSRDMNDALISNLPPNVNQLINTSSETALSSAINERENKNICSSKLLAQNVNKETLTISSLVDQPTGPQASLSDLKKGFKILDPANLNSDILKSNYLYQLPKDQVKNTIISLPNRIYLIPVSYFKKDNVVQIPGNSKIACFVDESITKSSGSVKNDAVINNLVQNENNVKSNFPVQMNMKNCGCVQNNNFEHSNPHIQVSKSLAVTQKKTELFRRCWSAKRNRKVDLEGFTMYDRLGFFKSEHVRAKKCFNILNTIIFDIQREISLLKSYLDSMKVCKSIVPKPARTGKTCLSLVALTKKHHLKECSIVLDRNEVHNYYKRRRLALKQQNRRRVNRNFQIPLSFEMIPFNSLNKINFNKPVLFINHHNFGTVNYANPEIETILFINTNNLVTEMCLDLCPQFKTAVQKKIVNIVEEKALKSFLGTYANQSISTHLPQKTKNISVWSEKLSKFKMFLLNNSEDKKDLQRCIQLDHNYSFDPSEERSAVSLLKIKRSIPFHLRNS